MQVERLEKREMMFVLAKIFLIGVGASVVLLFVGNNLPYATATQVIIVFAVGYIPAAIVYGVYKCMKILKGSKE